MNLSQRARYVLLGVTGVILVVAMVFQLRGGTSSDGPRGSLGPTPGPKASSDDYVAAKKAHLERLANAQSADPVAALVSFTKYVPAPEVQRMVGDAKPTFVWVRFPGAEPEPLPVDTTVSGTVADAAADLRSSVDSEVRELQAQAKTPELAALIEKRRQELAQLNADCTCVFALSVEEAEPRDLRELSKQPAVRLVDVPDPPSNDLDGWQLTPFVPR